MEDIAEDHTEAEELWLVRRSLERLVHTRFQPGWDADEEEAYRALTRREAALLGIPPVLTLA
jgi:hypothetical protein